MHRGHADLAWWEHPDADPYAVLDLPGASIEEAAAARRDVARRCHPDTTPLRGRRGEIATRHLIAADAAYDRLRRALVSV